jgi:flagellar basal body rod protein FlgG
MEQILNLGSIIYQDIGDLRYKTTSTITGELKITNHNFDKAILSGTFWFDAINSKGEKIQVREGRFDMEY